MNGNPQNGDVVSALFRLLETHRWDDISLSDIAAESGAELADLRTRVDSRFGILELFARNIDAEVIKSVDSDLRGEPARERLFDILMSRLDALQPHKAAIDSLMRSARRDPLLSAQLNRLACTSQGWMLEAAGISGKGIAGAIRIQGLVLAFARVLGIWLKDDDPDMARTMAELDKVLRRGEAMLQGLDRFCTALSPAARRSRSTDDNVEDTGIADA